MDPDAAAVIRILALQPHPEGGHYRETFRDAFIVQNGRAASTAIYFLLHQGERSRWHRIDVSEVWHWYAGAALSLHIAGPDTQKEIRLGPNLLAGERPQVVVPAAVWQMAESLGPGRWSAVPLRRRSLFQVSKSRPTVGLHQPNSNGATRRRSGIRAPRTASTPTTGASIPTYLCDMILSAFSPRAPPLLFVPRHRPIREEQISQFLVLEMR